jgi:hypothetical protein
VSGTKASVIPGPEGPPPVAESHRHITSQPPLTGAWKNFSLRCPFDFNSVQVRLEATLDMLVSLQGTTSFLLVLEEGGVKRGATGD